MVSWPPGSFPETTTDFAVQSENPIQFALPVQGVNVVAAAKTNAVNEHLGDGAPSVGHPDHLVPLLGVLVKIDFLPCYPFRTEQRLRPVAVGADSLRVHRDLGHSFSPFVSQIRAFIPCELSHLRCAKEPILWGEATLHFSV
jgi:hypothetical protein